MDYKSVIEEQIRELQKAQDLNLKTQVPGMMASGCCQIAKTIAELCREAREY